MVAVGESEESFCELLDNFKNDKRSTNVRGIHFKQGSGIVANPVYPLMQDIDRLPLPDKQLFYDKLPGLKRISYSIMASRGCPYSCSYCCNDPPKKIYAGTPLRRERSVGSVIAELERAKERVRHKESVLFYDEVFPSRMAWLGEFVRQYKEKINLPFKNGLSLQACRKRSTFGC